MPSLTSEIFKIYEDDIIHTRESLFSSIEKNSKKIKDACVNILDDKLQQDKGPLWGELYPWFIADITGVRKEYVEKVSTGWLAIYLHTIFIDKHLDKHVEIKPDELLASSILAKEGLISLYKIVCGTKYEAMFEQLTSSAATYELSDVVNQLNLNALNEKEEIAIGKNRILFACVGAISALSSGIQGDYIVELTHSILLSLQFLDDLADLEEDYHDKNFSYALSYGFKDIGDIAIAMSKEQIIERLVISKALENTVRKIKDSLGNGFAVIVRIKNELNLKDTHSHVYFLNLHNEICSFYQYIVEIGKDYQYKSSYEKRVIFGEIETRIYRCNVSS